jgi:hypothetical protein
LKVKTLKQLTKNFKDKKNMDIFFNSRTFDIEDQSHLPFK